MSVVHVDRITPEIFRIEIPLPGLVPKFVNVYVIRGKKRNLIIDTGAKRKECLDALHDGLNQIGVTLEMSDFFITHWHDDHMGLLPWISSVQSKFFLHPLELETLRSITNLNVIVSYLVKHGYPQARAQSVIDHFPTDKAELETRGLLNFDHLKDGDHLMVGRIEVIVLHTPGHTPGHACLYTPERKLLFSGDHVLEHISPGIMCISDQTNPLGTYMESLAKLKKLDLDMILSGHRNVIHNPYDRIDQLLAHHYQRCEQVCTILGRRPLSAYELASKMKWQLPYRNWEAVPDDQKWHATSEAIAHLRYLEEQGRLKRRCGDDVVRFGVV